MTEEYPKFSGKHLGKREGCPQCKDSASFPESATVEMGLDNAGTTEYKVLVGDGSQIRCFTNEQTVPD